MLVSAKAEYACLAMLELAARHGEPKPVRLIDIAEVHGIPQRFLVQILLQLKGAGLIASTRGAAGGYQLARSPDEISLWDVLEVVDSSESGSIPPRQRERSPIAGALHGVWDQILENRQRILEETTLATLVEAGQGAHYVI
jgi:Rrf2 family protein